jgi:hypothetical protein
MAIFARISSIASLGCSASGPGTGGLYCTIQVHAALLHSLGGRGNDAIVLKVSIFDMVGYIGVRIIITFFCDEGCCCTYPETSNTRLRVRALTMTYYAPYYAPLR